MVVKKVSFLSSGHCLSHPAFPHRNPYWIFLHVSRYIEVLTKYIFYSFKIKHNPTDVNSKCDLNNFSFLKK